MSTPKLVAQCAAFLSQLPRWKSPANGAISQPSDEGDVLVLQAHASDCLFLSELPSEEGVRLFRCMAPEPIETLDDKLWTVNAEGKTAWTWLQDEWALDNASVMYHPETGAMAWVRDLVAADLSEEPEKWQAEIEAWIAEADSLIESLGGVQEPLEAPRPVE